MFGKFRSRLHVVSLVITFALGFPTASVYSADATIDKSANAGDSGPPASAAANDDLTEIVVTGTSIRGVAPVGSQVISLTSEDMLQQGQTQVSDLLRDLPQVTNLGADDSRTAPGAAQRAIANVASGTAINLRGLGIEDTLTLVDGLRAPPGGGEGRFFDPNSLPTIAVQRLEVVPDGASAVYGSDAVAGVVNIVPVNKFEGVEAELRYGQADQYNQQLADILAGHDWGSGHAVIAFEYTRSSDLLAAKRPEQYVNSPVFGAVSTNTFPANLSNNAGPPPFAFPPGSTASHQFNDVSGTGTLNAANLAATSAAAAGAQGNWEGADALPLQIRKSLYSHVEQDLTDRLQLIVGGYFTQRDFARLETPLNTAGLAIPGLAAGPYQNVYNDIPATVGSDYSFGESLGSHLNAGYERAYQGRAGLDFDIGHGWKSSLLASYGQTIDDGQGPSINPQALSAAASCINPARPNGPYGFPVTNVTTCNNPATAFDAFSNGQPGTAGFGYPSAATYQNVLNEVIGYQIQHTTVSFTDYDLKADGPLMELPGGTMRLAAGLESQFLKRANETTSSIVTAATDDSVLQQFADTHRNIDSIYAELFVPLVGAGNAIPGVQSLSASLAGRFDHYHDSQNAISNPEGPIAGFNHDYGTTNPKIGLTWKPFHDLQIQGSFGTSFRAPVLGDYALGAPTLGIPFTVTPAVASVLGLPARCAVANACNMIEIQGGTTNLNPEKARTFSVGAEYTPSEVPGLFLSTNYYHIDLNDQIVVAGTGPWESNPGLATSLVKSGILTPNPAKGTLGTFSPTVGGYLSYGNNYVTNPSLQYAGYAGIPGFLLAQGFLPTSLLVDALSVNSGETRTDGIDYNIRYKRSTDTYGTFVIGDVGTYVFNFRQAISPGTPLVDYVNDLNYPVHFQTRGQLGWNSSMISANAFLNFVNAYNNPGIGRVASFTTIDTAIVYSPASWVSAVHETHLSLNATNLLNRAPPQTVNIPNQMAYDPQQASAIGRLVSLDLRVRF